MSKQAQANIANALAGSPAAFDSQGLETPPEGKLLASLAALGNGYFAGKGASQIAEALAGKLGAAAAAPAAAPELPSIAPGAKSGPPHALLAYKDNFGPGMSERSIYNVFGDTAHPAIKQVGWGSSVPEDVLRSAGIPITGRQAAKVLIR